MKEENIGIPANVTMKSGLTISAEIKFFGQPPKKIPKLVISNHIFSIPPGAKVEILLGDV